jgi:hypothetical protein
VYSLWPLFVFLAAALVVALVLAWLALLLHLSQQHKLSTLPAHLKSLFVRPCGTPTQEKPKVATTTQNIKNISGSFYLKERICFVFKEIFYDIFNLF